MKEQDGYPLIYPPLDGPENFRIQTVTHLRGELDREIEIRVGLQKKYQRAVNILDGVDTGATATGVALGALERDFWLP